MADIIDLIKHANDNKPVDFSSALNDILGHKAVEILDTAKEGLARSIFGAPEESDEESEISDEELEGAIEDLDDAEIEEINDQDIDQNFETGETDEDA